MQSPKGGLQEYSTHGVSVSGKLTDLRSGNRRKGISEIVNILKSKQPDAMILVSGILPRWKRNAADGMNFKNKQNVQNGKMKGYLGCTFCPQDNFSKHMFYDGTHLNTEGTAQHVRNYKYMIGKTTFNRGRYPTFVEKTNQGTASTYEQREYGGQHQGYRANVRRRQHNGQCRQSYMGQKTGSEKEMVPTNFSRW